MLAGLSMSPATPPKPTTDDGGGDGTIDWKSRMQRMIELQYEYSAAIGKSDDPVVSTRSSGGTTMTSDSMDTPTLLPPPLTTAPLNQQQQQQPLFVTAPPANENIVLQKPEKTPMAAPDDENNVGQGKLIFPIGYPDPLPPGPNDYNNNNQYQGAHNQQQLRPYTQIQLLPNTTHSSTPQEEFYPIIDDEYAFTDERDCRHYCSCFFYLLHWLMGFLQAENLHKSLCFGSIDGMLTGAGIVATFCGLGLVSSSSSIVAHWLVVAFSWAACSADALCMAVGHVRSTSVLAAQVADERRRERRVFETNRAEAKAKLVDMLLARGMLKIDAMSIVDTLEGYPEVFCSAVAGEGGLDLQHHESALFCPSESQVATTSYGAVPFSSSSSSANANAEARAVRHARQVAQSESFFMMAGFSVSGAVPALVFLFTTHMLLPGLRLSTTSTASLTIAIATTAVTSVLMALLGTWKGYVNVLSWFSLSLSLPRADSCISCFTEATLILILLCLRLKPSLCCGSAWGRPTVWAPD